LHLTSLFYVWHCLFDSSSTLFFSFPVPQVQPFLPRWLAQPKLVQKRIKDNLVPIGDVPGIHPRLLKKLQMNGIESFFPGTLTVLLCRSELTYVVSAVCCCIFYVISEVKYRTKTSLMHLSDHISFDPSLSELYLS